jgi:hypothetical protein
MQARSVAKGQSLLNEAAPIVSEYITRKRMTALGFTSNINELTFFKAECFQLIEQEIDKVQAEEAKKRGSRKR